ncbi:MAG: hypothetical protein HRU41_28600 [Saprospiraceae bacterium]|nr:hypothetical protein [Saprospiraceae bacterium]
MKKGLLLIFSLLFLAFYPPFDAESPSKSKATFFQQLELNVAYELEELRVDIIRKETTSADGDGNSTTEDVPYHPLGFDLGNGLFYDLNGNLALRLKHLFDLDGRNEFSLKRIERVQQNRGIEMRKVSEKAICREWRGILGNDRSRCLDVYDQDGVVQVSRNGRFCYQIVEEEGEVKFSRNRQGRRWTRLLEEGEQTFVEQIRDRRRDVYTQENGEVRLGRDILLQVDETGKKIEIFRLRRNNLKPRLIFTLERKGQELLLKDRRRLIRRIGLERDKVTVYGRRRALFAYEKSV